MSTAEDALRDALAAVAAEGGDLHDALAGAIDGVVGRVGDTSRLRAARQILRNGAGGAASIDDSEALVDIGRLVAGGRSEADAVAIVARRLPGDLASVQRRLRRKLQKFGQMGSVRPSTPDIAGA
jgi:hypothetical protein